MTTKTARSPRNKRCSSNNFFEVIYEPNDSNLYDYHNCDFKSKTVVSYAVVDAIIFSSNLTNGTKSVTFSVAFEKCDFEGDFTSDTPSFKKCRFYSCDFGFSKWKRAKFKDCEFNKCSFSMATLEDCEFRGCKFTEIFLSGNETILSGTTFTNPAEFINAASTNFDKDVLAERGTSLEHQMMRLEGTKASVSRIIMASHSTNGSEADYYKAVETYQRTSINAKILALHYDLSRKPGVHVTFEKVIDLIIAYAERNIVTTAGIFNKWGASVARPALIGVVIIAFFTMLYWMTGLRRNIFQSLVTSADITLLVGYTKHVTLADKSAHQMLYAFNMIIGLCWYSIFIPTIIGRISRVR